MMRGRHATGPAALTAAALLLFTAGRVSSAPEGGSVEVVLSLPEGAAAAAVSLTLGERSAEVAAGELTYRMDGVAPGSYVLMAEAPGDGRLLGAAVVTVAGGGAATAELALQKVDSIDRFCAACHPAAGEAAGKGQVPRDLHGTAAESPAGVVTCESCHTLHRPTPYGSFAVSSYTGGKNDLCASCHSGGHSRQTAGVEGCFNCHTFRYAEVQRGTSLISAASRTLPVMKVLSKGEAPEIFGCTYCHGVGLERERMKEVLTHFGRQTSKHPVGTDLRTGKATRNEFLSSTATAFASELECTDCHDPALLVDQDPQNLAGPAPYANHADPESAGRTANPSMLRGGADVDSLCRSCHGEGGSFAKADLPPPPHGDGALAEPDGTPLRTSSCRECHNSHYSGKDLLFADGRQGADDVGTGDTRHCATRCHYRGDSDGSYDTRGHGMAVGSRRGTPMKFGCGACHSSDKRHRSERPGMLNFQQDERVSTFGTSVTSICQTCHRQYGPHSGAGGRVAGCLDCHDEHAEGVQSAGNRAMIAGTVPGGSGGEATVYAGEAGGALDYYRPSGDGLCDNAACHGGLRAPDGTPMVPLSGLMKGGHHSGGDRQPGSDCGECHHHESREGSWAGG